MEGIINMSKNLPDGIPKNLPDNISGFSQNISGLDQIPDCNILEKQICNIDGNKVNIDIKDEIHKTAEKIILLIFSYICSQINNIKNLNCNKDFENNFIMKIITIILDKLNINKNKILIKEINEVYGEKSDPDQEVRTEKDVELKDDEDKNNETGVQDKEIELTDLPGVPKIIANGTKRGECFIKVSSCITVSKDNIKNELKEKILKLIKDNKDKKGEENYFHSIIEGIKYSIRSIKKKDIEHNCYNYVLKKYYYDLIEDYTINSDSIISKIEIKIKEGEGEQKGGSEEELLNKIKEGSTKELKEGKIGQILEELQKGDTHGLLKQLEDLKQGKGELLEQIKQLNKGEILEQLKKLNIGDNNIGNTFQYILKNVSGNIPKEIDKTNNDNNINNEENIDDLFLKEIFNNFCIYLTNDKNVIIGIIDEIISFLLNMSPENNNNTDNDNDIVLDSFKTNLLKKNISEFLNELYKKKKEYQKIKDPEKQEKEEEKKDENNNLKNKYTIFLKKKISGLKKNVNFDTSNFSLTNAVSIASTTVLQNNLNKILNSTMNKISKEFLSEIIPKKNEVIEITDMYIKKIKNEIITKLEENIDKKENKKENLKEIFYPLIQEYKKDYDKELKKKEEIDKIFNEEKEIINKVKSDFFKDNLLNKIEKSKGKKISKEEKKFDINNMSIINYIIKLSNKIEENKILLELNNIYLIKYKPILPKGKCKGETLMFFDETLKGKILEQQSLMMYIGDLKFLLLCDEYDSRKRKSKIKIFKKYEDFEILSMIQKNVMYEIKKFENSEKNENNSFFNKFYSLENISPEKKTVGGGFLNKFVKPIENIKSSASSLGELGAYPFKKIYNLEIQKVKKEIIEDYNERKKENNNKYVSNNYNIIGNIVKIKFPNNTNYYGEFYGIIFKKMKDDIYEILFKSEKEKKSLGIKFEGKVENDYLHSFEIKFKNIDTFYNNDYDTKIYFDFEINKNDNDNDNDNDNEKDEEKDVELTKVFSFNNYYNNIIKKNKNLTFRKIVSSDNKDVPFFENTEKANEIKKNLGVLFDALFFNKELKPEKSYSSLKIKDEKGSKCSTSFNKKIKCLFLFTNNEGENIYLKAEHYVVINSNNLEKKIEEKKQNGGQKSKKLTKKNNKKLTKKIINKF